MTTSEPPPGRSSLRLGAVLREEERVTPLELFFDLVFVLAITQCTAFLASHQSWSGLGKGTLLLGLLWWAWVGYSWLTSVVNPEEGFVRIAMFASMGALLVVSLCVPQAFGDLGLTFAIAYGVVRFAHVALSFVGSRDDPALRKSVGGLTISTTIGVSVLIGASFLEESAQVAIWAFALILDAAGPYFFGTAGWKLVPGHFAERHGLIMIVALGESIVAVGAGAGSHVDSGVIIAAVLSIALAAVMWWAYFDVVALVAARRLIAAEKGVEQNSLARDSYSYLHFPMVMGIVLVALGLKKTLAHVDEHLNSVSAFALVGGAAIYLSAHVAFRFRNVHSINRQRVVVSLILIAFIPFASRISALSALAVVTSIFCAMITYEAIRFAEGRKKVRHQLGNQPPSP